MGCCLGALVLAGAPRLAMLFWWWMDPARIARTFAGFPTIGSPGVPGWAWTVAGVLILPWTTLAYVWVAPGGLTTFEWIVLVVALLIDLGTHGGGGRAYNKRRSG